MSSHQISCVQFFSVCCMCTGSRCATGEGWQEVMLHVATDDHSSSRRCVDQHSEEREQLLREKRPALFQSPDLCHPALFAQLYDSDAERRSACSCGTPLARPYFITFIFFCSFLVSTNPLLLLAIQFLLSFQTSFQFFL